MIFQFKQLLPDLAETLQKQYDEDLKLVREYLKQKVEKRDKPEEAQPQENQVPEVAASPVEKDLRNKRTVPIQLFVLMSREYFTDF